MAKEKTKKLLDKLSGIAGNKDLNNKPITIPDTNKMWSSTLDSGIYNFPKHYNKVKKYKETDEDGIEDSWFYIDRMYGTGPTQRLIQADGSEYSGKIYSKRRLIKGVDGNNFYSKCHSTADGRWFCNSGMPIEPPTEIEKDEKEEEQIPEEAESEETEVGSQE